MSSSSLWIIRWRCRLEYLRVCSHLAFFLSLFSDYLFLIHRCWLTSLSDLLSFNLHPCLRDVCACYNAALTRQLIHRFSSSPFAYVMTPFTFVHSISFITNLLLYLVRTYSPATLHLELPKPCSFADMCSRHGRALERYHEKTEVRMVHIAIPRTNGDEGCSVRPGLHSLETVFSCVGLIDVNSMFWLDNLH